MASVWEEHGRIYERTTPAEAALALFTPLAEFTQAVSAGHLVDGPIGELILGLFSVRRASNLSAPAYFDVEPVVRCITAYEAAARLAGDVASVMQHAAAGWNVSAATLQALNSAEAACGCFKVTVKAAVKTALEARAEVG
jgi:hypothetical protein